MKRRDFLHRSSAFAVFPLTIRGDDPPENDRFLDELNFRTFKTAGESKEVWNSCINGLPVYDDKIFLVSGIGLNRDSNGKLIGKMQLALFETSTPSDRRDGLTHLERNILYDYSVMGLKKRLANPVVRKYLGDTLECLTIEKQSGLKVGLNNVKFDHSSVEMLLPDRCFRISFEVLGKVNEK